MIGFLVCFYKGNKLFLRRKQIVSTEETMFLLGASYVREPIRRMAYNSQKRCFRVEGDGWVTVKKAYRHPLTHL